MDGVFDKSDLGDLQLCSFRAGGPRAALAAEMVVMVFASWWYSGR